jgi:hypothetical protein
MMMVKLRNGAEELVTQVDAIHMSLRTLFEQHPISFYDVVMFAKNSSYNIFPVNAEPLVQLGLLNEGPVNKYSIHDSVKSIILSSVEGEGSNLKLVNPLKE